MCRLAETTCMNTVYIRIHIKICVFPFYVLLYRFPNGGKRTLNCRDEFDIHLLNDVEDLLFRAF